VSAAIEVDSYLVHRNSAAGLDVEVGAVVRIGDEKMWNTSKVVDQRSRRLENDGLQGFACSSLPNDSSAAYDGDLLVERQRVVAHSVFLVALLWSTQN
jgi:hypothetical protein